MSVVTAKNSKFSGRKSVKLSELADESILVLSESVAPIVYMEIIDLFRTFHITPKISNSFDDLVSIYVSSSSGIGVSVIPTSVAAYTSDEYTDSYLIDDADTSIAYVMAWGKNISNPAAKLFMEAVQKYAKGDVLPLLYVSQTKTDKEKNITDACFVERILPEGRAELVQTILLDNHNDYYGWAVQWAVDKKRKRLIGFGNTIDNNNPKNNFRIMVFKLPTLKQGKTVVLKKEDIIENYLIQDYDMSYPHVQIGQGGVVAGNCLVMPTGVGSSQYPSVIYSWDLKNKKMVSVLNMQSEVPFEFEDCDFFQNKMYIQCNEGAQGRMKIMEWKDKK